MTGREFAASKSPQHQWKSDHQPHTCAVFTDDDDDDDDDAAAAAAASNYPVAAENDRAGLGISEDLRHSP